MSDAPKLSEALGHDFDERNLKLYGRLTDSLYGFETTCPESAVFRADPCPRCQGTGKVREGGLLERVEARAREMHGWGFADGDPYWREALRTELGEVPNGHPTPREAALHGGELAQWLFMRRAQAWEVPKDG